MYDNSGYKTQLETNGIILLIGSYIILVCEVVDYYLNLNSNQPLKKKKNERLISQ